jgi:hypothetical protein
MARFSGTKSITPNGSNTLQGSGSVNVISTGSSVNIVSGASTNIVSVTNLNIQVIDSTGVITVGTGTNTQPGFLTVGALANVGSFNNTTARAYDLNGNLLLDNGSTVSLDQTLFSTTAERQAASAYFAGGVGIEQDLSVGGFIYGRVAAANTATTSSQIIVLSSNSATQYYLTFAQDLNTQGTILYGDNTSDYSPTGLRYQPDIGKIFTERLAVQNIENSTSTITGAATVAGGVGIKKDLYVGGAILPETASTGTIGEPDYAWATAYLDNVYTKFVGNASGNISVSPNNGISEPRHGTGGIVDVFGDIRVRGNNPVGTAPVVTNILYVTMDGDDTNDGRAMDTSRACRTITGAVNSPYYQPGTQIRVAPGHYLEDNPIQLKPYTSIMGSDLRTTSIEPINKTQDLFHMNSGCYLAFMQFLNGRSGLLPGAYAADYNRGAYATAFPPLPEGERIDLFHSPYIQNCTNLTGPWLQDGTMFVPDEVVQIPTAVGIGSWEANTTTVVVNILNEPIAGFINAGVPGSSSTQYTGNLSNLIDVIGTVNTAAELSTKPTPTILSGYIANDTGDLWVYTGAPSIELGMSISSGQQNQGFFNARTLMLANKPFLQAQVVAFIESTFNSGSFVYNQATCQRDTGLIVDAIAVDMLYGSASDSTFAGLQYWSQGTYTGNIPAEISNTIASINYLNDLVANIASTEGNGSVVTQVNTLFNTIISILNGNLSGITDSIISASLPTTDGAIVATYAALQSQKATLQQNIIDWITATYPLFDYNTDTCYRDVGYIIDAVSFDLLHTCNLQSIKSGVYYYSFNADNTQIPNEIPQTTAAYNFIRSIIPNIVTNVEILGTYQGIVQQQTTTTDPALVPGTSHEALLLQNNIDVITNIIRNGPEAAADKTPQNLISSGNVEVTNAYNMLLANREFIKAEVRAYIDQQFNYFTYNKQLSYRDTGILVENISYDAAFGGNEKAVESGLAYWNGVVSVIPGQTTQCISAIDYLNQLSQKVVRNELCPVLPVPAGIPLADQVINTVLTGGEIILPAIKSLYNIVTNVIEKGPTAAPVSYTSTGPDAAFVSAEILMQANRKFIQEDTINWINNTFQTFPFNQIKCRRDTGLIVDSIAADLLYPTPTNSQVTFAGVQYWNHGKYVGQIPNEINQTVDAVTYLRDISVKVIQNITTATDALVGVVRYSDGVQTTSSNYASAVEISAITTYFNNIITILKGNTAGWTDLIVSNGAESNLPSVHNAYNLLQANKDYMAGEIVAFVDATNPGFTYTTSTCIRDVGYIIDSISFDLLHGGNRQSIQAGFSYYGFTDTNITIQGQEIQTTDAFTFLGNLAGQIIQNIPVTPLQNKVSQVLSLPASDAPTASLITAEVSTLTNIITNGIGVVSELIPISLTASTSTAVQNAYAILEANRFFIVEETISYINNVYNTTPFVYNTQTCARDTALIVGSIAIDLLYDTVSDSTFTGLQYWATNGYTGRIASEITTTTAAISYLESLANGYAGTEVATVSTLFQTILDILNPAIGTTGVTDKIIPNGLASTDTNVISAYTSIQANKSVMQQQVVNYVTGALGFTNFNTSTCYRDVGYIIDSVCFDLLNGGNKQSIKSAVYYYNFTYATSIPGEIPETSAAYDFIATLIPKIVAATPIKDTFQPNVAQVTNLPPATVVEAESLEQKIGVIVDIINNGPKVAGPKIPMNLTMVSNGNALKAYNLVIANTNFIVAETLAFINATFTGPKSFNYNQELCYRDTGLIVDAVSQDILLGGNQRSIEAGLSYWNQGYNYVTGQETNTTMAINHAKDIALQIIANKPVIAQSGTVTTQIINPFFQYGGDYMPDEAVRRNFDIITNIIANGPKAAPPVYAGGGLFALTGINGADVRIAPTVTYLENISTGTYVVGLSTSTVGHGHNSTLYFGETRVFPLQNNEVDTLSLQLTGSSSSWDSRKVDAIGGMGGSLVDGAVISDRSPINSFVYDAFTQLTQGGRGVRITNNGYAQLVSVFTIFASVAVQVDNGGIASIVNSNANFGDLCLVAKGYGKRSFSGTVFNPSYRSYPFSPSTDPNYLDQYYPTGYWPNKGTVEVFVPDLANRPHISQVMEVIPPKSHLNEQTLPGFLNAQPSTSTLVAGTIVLEGISNADVAVGNTVYIRDQFGSAFDKFPYVHDEFGNPILDELGNTSTNTTYGIWYAATGTVVTDVGYNSITLNQELTSGASFPNNSNYFTLYFCGNAYYTVQTSSVANSPYKPKTNILSANSDPNYQGPATDQIAAHVNSINYLKTLVDQVIANIPITPSPSNTVAQFKDNAVAGGQSAQPFIDLRFNYITSIIGAVDINAAESVVPQSTITQKGTIPTGAGSAVTLIKNNIEFLASEIYAYVQDNYSTLLGTSGFQYGKCQRDIGLILQQIIYDLETGGNYNSVYSGLSYWARPGTHHIVELGEAVNRTDLFPDGCIVNFYQRSYISASGYVFEYVGAGSNYGALPQVGRADPVQTQEVVQLDTGKVFFTSTDQNGDFRIGPGLVISQATGVLSGRTFTQSLFANMTPFILAIEGI